MKNGCYYNRLANYILVKLSIFSIRSKYKHYTTLGKNVTIGNQVNIGHNCIVGNDSVILANSVVCGRSIVEKGVRIAPGAVISSAKVIGEDSKVTIGAVVTQDIPKGNKVSGNFAIDHEYFCFMVNP